MQWFLHSVATNLQESLDWQLIACWEKYFEREKNHFDRRSRWQKSFRLSAIYDHSTVKRTFYSCNISFNLDNMQMLIFPYFIPLLPYPIDLQSQYNWLQSLMDFIICEKFCSNGDYCLQSSKGGTLLTTITTTHQYFLFRLNQSSVH